MMCNTLNKHPDPGGDTISVPVPASANNNNNNDHQLCVSFEMTSPPTTTLSSTIPSTLCTTPPVAVGVAPTPPTANNTITKTLSATTSLFDDDFPEHSIDDVVSIPTPTTTTTTTLLSHSHHRPLPKKTKSLLRTTSTATTTPNPSSPSSTAALSSSALTVTMSSSTNRLTSSNDRHLQRCHHHHHELHSSSTSNSTLRRLLSSLLPLRVQQQQQQDDVVKQKKQSNKNKNKMIPSNRVKSSITSMPTVYSLSACTSAAFDNGGDDDKHCDDDDDEVGDGVVVGVGRNNDNDNDARLMTTTGSSSSSSSSTPTPTPTPRNPKLRHQVSSCRSVVLSDPAVSSSPSLPHYNQHQQHQRTVLSSSSIPDARVNLVHPHSFHLWHLHVFSLPHNAIRAELIDLCAMLHSLLSHPSPPLHLLREWYPYFHGFLSTYLTLEQTVLLPWVYLGVEDARILAFRDAMAPDHVLIGQLLDELTNVLTLTKSRPTSFTLPLLLRAVRDLVNPLLVYLDREERVLPNLIQARNCRVEAGNVERVMAKSLDVGLLLRWVPSRSQRVKLRMKFLSVPDLVSGFCQSRVKTARHLAIVRSIVRHPQ